MAIKLTIDPNLPHAEEARRIITHFVEMINQGKHQIFNHQESALQNIMQKYNAGNMPITAFDQSIKHLMDDIQKGEKINYVRQHDYAE